MVITSLNLYDFSEQNNREMGVLVTKQDDSGTFTEAVEETNRIMNLASQQVLRHGKSEPSSAKTTDRVKTTPKENKEGRGSVLLRGFADILLDTVGMKKGFCIGCKTRIDYDEYKPYCPACYQQWAKHKSQKASYCHNCGRQTTTSLNKPLCLSCFKNT